MLVLTPMKRQPLDLVMQDKWMNIGYEDDPLTPYKEPPQSFPDPLRVEIMVNMGFTREEINESLTRNKFDSVTSTYLLLARRPYNLDLGPSCDTRTGSNHSVRQPGGAPGVSAASQSGGSAAGGGVVSSTAPSTTGTTTGGGAPGSGVTGSGRGVPRSASATNPSTGGGAGGSRRASQERSGGGAAAGGHLSGSSTASPSAVTSGGGPGSFLFIPFYLLALCKYFQCLGNFYDIVYG